MRYRCVPHQILQCFPNSTFPVKLSPTWAALLCDEGEDTRKSNYFDSDPQTLDSATYLCHFQWPLTLPANNSVTSVCVVGGHSTCTWWTRESPCTTSGRPWLVGGFGPLPAPRLPTPINVKAASCGSLGLPWEQSRHVSSAEWLVTSPREA